MLSTGRSLGDRMAGERRGVRPRGDTRELPGWRRWLADLRDMQTPSHDAGLLWAAVDRLPERCRRLLRVVAFESRPDYGRLAAELDMPIGSIGPTRGRCLAKLRVALMQTGAVG